MTCRDEILLAFGSLANRTGRDVFSPAEIIEEMRLNDTAYAESTIRTHIVSRMCANAPDHHAVVYQDLERVGPGVYKLRDSTTQRVAADRNRPDLQESTPSPPVIDDIPTTPRSDGEPLRGTSVDVGELAELEFAPFELRVRRTDVPLPYGIGTEWDTIGDVPRSPGIYAFTVEDNDSIHVTYVGLTEHLWMVTKGRLPDGQARGGQRYGRPKHAGVTRQRVNGFATEQIQLGHSVKHWVRPLSAEENEDLRAQLRAAEEALIQRWDLRTTGWNRG